MKHQGRAVSNIQFKQYVAILDTNINQWGRWAHQPKGDLHWLRRSIGWSLFVGPGRLAYHAAERGPGKQ